MPVTSITIQAIPTLVKGITHQLVVLTNESVDVTLGCLLSVSDKSTFAVSNQGVLTALNGGKANVHARYGHLEHTIEATCYVPVDSEAPILDNPSNQNINLRLNYFEVGFQHLATPEANKLLARFQSAHPFTLPVNAPGSKASAEMAGASTTVLVLAKDSVDIGTITFETGVTEGIISIPEEQKFDGQVLKLKSGNSVGDGLTGISVTLYGVPDVRS